MTIVQKFMGWFFGRCLPERNHLLETENDQLERGLIEPDATEPDATEPDMTDSSTTLMQRGLKTLGYLLPRFMNENNGGEYWEVGDGIQQSNSPSYVPPSVVYNKQKGEVPPAEQGARKSPLPAIH